MVLFYSALYATGCSYYRSWMLLHIHLVLNVCIPLLCLLQDLLLYKDEGFSRIQTSVELAQTVLANTAPSGHRAINQALADLQEQWSNLASKMVETKVSICLSSLVITVMDSILIISVGL